MHFLTVRWEMTMNPQVTHITRKMFTNLRLISKTRNACARLVHALVASHLDSNNALVAGCSSKCIRPLQMAQNCTARLRKKARYTYHI